MRTLIACALLLFLAAGAWAEPARGYFSREVGIGPSYGGVGLSLELKPVDWGAIFGSLFAADRLTTYALGLRVYPLGGERFFSPFVHAYYWGFGLMADDSSVFLSAPGVGVGGEWVWESGQGLRLGCDFSSIEGDPVIFPFVAYTEKF